MTRVQVFAGICGFSTTIEATNDGHRRVSLTIESECEAVQRLAAKLTQVDCFREVTFSGAGPLTLRLASECLLHASCPVPVGIIKAVEVAGGLALPADVSIKVSKDE